MTGAYLATAKLTLEIKLFALHYDRIMITPRSNLRAAIMPLHAPQRFATWIALICCSLSLLLVPRGIINAFCNRPTVNGPRSTVSPFFSCIYLRYFFVPSLPSRPRDSCFAPFDQGCLIVVPLRNRGPTRWKVLLSRASRFLGHCVTTNLS